MPRLITAAFRDHADAEQALQSLLTTGVARDRIALYGGQRHPSSELAPRRTVAPDASDAAAIGGLGLPAADAALLSDALARGHALVTARVEDEAAAERALGVLRLFDAINLDAPAAMPPSGNGAPLAAGLTAGGTAGATNTAAMPGAGGLIDGGSDLGTGDLRAGENLSLANQGRVSTGPTTGREYAEDRAGMPGVNALGGRDAGQGPAAGDASGAGAPAAASPRDTFQRESERTGPVRVYVR